jgi:cytochrome c-type biogenesis protein CcmH/NrfG
MQHCLRLGFDTGRRRGDVAAGNDFRSKWTSIDEYGIVRSTRLLPESIEREIVSQTFADDAASAAQPERYGPVPSRAFETLQSVAQATNSADAWRELGDSLILWGGPKRLPDAIDAYTAATRVDPQDGRAFFRLGVALRQRYESAVRQENDFQAAVVTWGRALELDPNQDIWRRRIQ